MEPSSADRGFFQEPPVVQNQFHDDVAYQRILRLFVPQDVAARVGPEMAVLGGEVLSDEVFGWVSDAERNLPFVRGQGRDAFGRPTGGELVTSEGWRRLQDFGIRKGMVAFNYDTDLGEFTRVVQMLRLHLWEGSCANVACPSAMQDGAARLLQLHLSKASDTSQSQGQDKGQSTGHEEALRLALRDAFDRLTSRDPARAWTSGQWMTERPGGSDVSQSETVAVYAPFPSSSPPLADPAAQIPLGPWSVSGAKFFSSATDAGMTIMLARTPSSSGLSAFFAPTRRQQQKEAGRDGGGAAADTELNGVRITRLKSKLGTQPLPTAELELNGMRAWLLGAQGRGVAELATVLGITRVHSAVAAVGYLGRGLGVARAYARVRHVAAAAERKGGSRRARLCENPLHVRTLARMSGEYRGLMLLTFFTAWVMGVDERGTESAYGGDDSETTTRIRMALPRGLATPLLRALTSLCKAYVCRAVVPLMHGCMEALGGVGYLLNSESESINVARLFRDACVLPIWEGTTDVLASDFVRALKKQTTQKKTENSRPPPSSSLEALDWVVQNAAGSPVRGEEEAVSKRWRALRGRIEGGTIESLLPSARDLLLQVGDVLVAVLLRVDAQSDGDVGSRAVYRRFLSEKRFVGGGDAHQQEQDSSFATDLAIVYGSDFKTKAEMARL